MIIALAVENNNFDSVLSDVFSRCKYIIIYNSADYSKKIILNPFAATFDGAGIQTSQLLIENNCDVLITNKIGIQAFIFLDSVGIKVYKSHKNKASAVIELFNQGRLEEAAFQNGSGRERRKRFRRRRGF